MALYAGLAELTVNVWAIDEGNASIIPSVFFVANDLQGLVRVCSTRRMTGKRSPSLSQLREDPSATGRWRRVTERQAG